jgi:hypothetical protein
LKVIQNELNVLEKKCKGYPIHRKACNFDMIGFARRTKKHITMHLLVGSNREATSASPAYVDGRIAWPIETAEQAT